jgi:hypothetical protein
MTKTKTVGLLALSLTCLSLGAIGDAAAQTYPNKPIHWIVAYPPGARRLITARLLRACRKKPQPAVRRRRPATYRHRAGAEGCADGYGLSSIPNDRRACETQLYSSVDILVAGFIRVPNVTDDLGPGRRCRAVLPTRRPTPAKINGDVVGVGTSIHIGRAGRDDDRLHMLHVPYRVLYADLQVGRSDHLR